MARVWIAVAAAVIGGCAGSDDPQASETQKAAVAHGNLVADIRCDQEFGAAMLTYEARKFTDGATVVTCEVETGGKSQTGTGTYARSEGFTCTAGTWKLAWSYSMGVLAKDGTGPNQLMTECEARKLEGGSLKSTSAAYVFRE